LSVGCRKVSGVRGMQALALETNARRRAKAMSPVQRSGAEQKNDDG